MGNHKLLKKTSLHIFLLIGVVISLAPFYWMVVGATNPSGDVLSFPPKLVPGNYLFENYKNLSESIDIVQAVLNSSVISIIYVLMSLLVCSTAGYAFAKYKFKGNNLIFASFLLAMMIPYQATIIPLFQVFGSLDWINTYRAVLLPQICYPFAIFLIRQNMKGIPDSLLEAARIDGAGELYIFFRIVLPTMKPTLAAVSIFLFTHQWNNFMWPLIVMTTQENYTLPVALSTLAGLNSIDYGQLMLGTTISVLPIMIVFLILQKHFVSGILGGSIKE
ncbi:carbohydrate ABC transporter permease [Niallia taxi]|uniref:carbohydrate ABC transporter permease n=1 Tax=Niallia taxi TaxID=2499688 RepID=UPI0015F6CA57|nr:carbohydrate ABC transporter permease [Niallia taxi]MCM3213122.1 carbohydrate ABC transporter permease [Niallia taxi]MDK8643613.1 carbohydrate ABC transporter permease [Niallia taxi]MED4036465.1 carbohydrate ABC transporter permease [Niallia taxi]